ncbi:nucleotidyltransferase domain-containing protein [Agrobacterium tumefaciens]
MGHGPNHCHPTLKEARSRHKRHRRDGPYLFGSTARDEAGSSSDLDVFID